MFLGFLLFWMIFNGRITLEIVLVGVVISAVLTVCWYRLFPKSRNLVVLSPRTVWYAGRYIVSLVVEIIRCNVKVMHYILHPSEEIRPQLVTFRVKLKKESHKVALANSITLTPGTITVGLQGDQIRVHGLDASFLEGIEECDMVTRLEAMEEGQENE